MLRYQCHTFSYLGYIGFTDRPQFAWALTGGAFTPTLYVGAKSVAIETSSSAN
jgi:hypothetical protein